MHEAPVAFVNHKTAGRIRLRVPSKKKDFAYFRMLEEDLPAVSGVQSVQTNPLTAGVLIRHSSDPDHIVQMTEKRGLFRFEHKAFVQANLQGRISEAFRGIDIAFKDMSGNELDLGGAAFVVLLGMSIHQIIKGNITTLPWYAAGWYALNIFLKSSPGPQQAR